MMTHFEVIELEGKRYLALVDTSNYNYWTGFHRIVKELS